MLPFVITGITDASATRRPSSPCTFIVDGSTTDAASVPILAVPHGCSAVSASRATHSRISSSVRTEGPGESSPASYGSNAGWLRMCRAVRTASSHSRRSFSVER